MAKISTAAGVDITTLPTRPEMSIDNAVGRVRRSSTRIAGADTPIAEAGGNS